jgi:hypothetical protein
MADRVSRLLLQIAILERQKKKTPQHDANFHASPTDGSRAKTIS